ncbi:MAG TPA: hypothetical protein VG676_00120, partial [Chitinophagaceae bacterium]|nr:hypothetical protein [Chitinophagaceae bacterium]
LHRVPVLPGQCAGQSDFPCISLIRGNPYVTIFPAALHLLSVVRLWQYSNTQNQLEQPFL